MNIWLVFCIIFLEYYVYILFFFYFERVKFLLLMPEEGLHRNGFFYFVALWIIAILGYCFLFKAFHVPQLFLPAVFCFEKVPYLIMGELLKWLILLGSVATFGWMFKQKKTLVIDYFDGVYLLFIAWSFLSTLWSINEANAIHLANNFLAIYLFYFTCKQLFYHFPSPIRSTISIVLPLFVLLFVGVYFYHNANMIARLDDSLTIYQKIIQNTESFIGGKNLTAIFSILIFTLLALFTMKENWRFYSFMAMLVLVMLILFLGSRNAYVGLGVFGLIFITINKLRSKWVGYFLIGGAVLLFFYFQFVDFDSFLDHLRYNTMEGRVVVWQRTMSYFLDSPIWGNGLGQWDVERFQYEISRRRVHPHNDFIRILSELGIIGFSLFISLISILFYRLLKLIRLANKNISPSYYAMLIGALVCYCTMAFIDEIFYKLNHTVILMMIWSMINVNYITQFPNALKKNSISNYRILFIPVVLLAFNLVYIRVNKNWLANAKQSFTTKEFAQAEVYIEKTNTYWFNQWGNRPIGLIGLSAVKKDAGKYEDKLLSVLVDFPYHTDTRKRLFYLYLEHGLIEDAIDQLHVLMYTIACKDSMDILLQKIKPSLKTSAEQEAIFQIEQQILEQCIRKRNKASKENTQLQE